MEFLSPEAFATRQPEHPRLKCRRSFIGYTTVFFFFLLAAAVCGFFAVTKHAAFYYFTFVFALFALLYRKPFLALSKQTNWLLLDDGDHLWINLRSFLNSHFPKDRICILRIPHSEVQWLQMFKERREVPTDQNRTQMSFHKILHLKLNVSIDQLENIERHLREDIYEKELGSRSRYVHYPVALKKSDSLLMIDWEGTTPRLTKALKILGEQFKILDPKKLNWGSWRDLDPKQTDDMVIHLVQFGNNFDAIRLLRQKNQMSLKEAKDFVEELKSSAK